MNKTTDMQTNVLKISEDVLIRIIEFSVKDINGIHSLMHSRIKFVNLFSKTEAPSAVSVKLKDGAADVTVSIVVSYNCNVKQVAEQLQVRIKNDIQNMTSIAVAKVNVIIDSIAFDNN